MRSTIVASVLVLAGCSAQGGAGASSGGVASDPPLVGAPEAPSASDPSDAGAAGDAPVPNDYARAANETHAFVVTHLLTPQGSYRTRSADDRTDEWHDVSQLGADVAMLALGDASFQPYVDRTAGFLDKLWDHASTAGGYFATSAADGTGVATDTKFVDDNALAGVTWLDAYDQVSDASRRAAYLASARATANFLMQSALWDTTFGGGFYWSTARIDKPTQSNGLALQLFARLADLTGGGYYRDWALSVLAWLDGTMFDAATGLYAWKYGAAGRSDTYFTYDQAIVLDADLVLFAQTHDGAKLARARDLADAMHRTLWNPTTGGYVISTADGRLSPAFSAWASCTLVHLFEVDGDRKWLVRAATNVDVLSARLRDPATGGYYASSQPDGSSRSSDMQAVDQAWMQRAQAMLARHR